MDAAVALALSSASAPADTNKLLFDVTVSSPHRRVVSSDHRRSMISKSRRKKASLNSHQPKKL
jgi:hypothetical protein